MFDRLLTPSGASISAPTARRSTFCRDERVGKSEKCDAAAASRFVRKRPDMFDAAIQITGLRRRRKRFVFRITPP